MTCIPFDQTTLFEILVVVFLILVVGGAAFLGARSAGRSR